MDKFVKFSGIAAPMPLINIDTDMLIPKQFLKTIKRTGLGENLFFEMRYDTNGSLIKDFILNKDHYSSASIIVAGDNFGCGSSREHAPWALKDFGIKCVISTSFADIFFNNCFKNGILPIILSDDDREVLMEDASIIENSQMTIDLDNQKIIRKEGDSIDFDVDEFKKYCLLNGLDDIGLTLKNSQKIAEFEKKYSEQFSWA
jgi:3-isopropylmalate/(R)-2-methylmalate dehydratase small subunit